MRKVVHVDDFLPIKIDALGGFHLIMGRSKEPGELWVSLLEKAWAKLHGSYSQIEGGLPTFVFTHLSNMPSLYLCHKTEHDKRVLQMQIWQKISQAMHMDCVMTSCAGTHAYGLLSCRSVEDTYLIHLRNPWGDRAFPARLK